jgi:hypothetical protein
MTIKAYFDKSESEDRDYLTLACFAGSDKTWNSFEKEWKDTLESSGAPQSKKATPYFHAREAYHNQGGYKGWDAGRVFNLATALFGVIGRYIFSEKEPERALIAFSRTIKCSDYINVVNKGNHLRDIKLLFLDHCFAGVTCHPLIHEENGQYCTKVELIFDQNEEFLPIMKNLKRLKGEQRVFWADLVSDMREADMKENVGIQAADMLAWAANRYFSMGPTARWAQEFAAIWLSSQANHHFLDEESLMILYDENGNYREGAKLPSLEIRMPGVYRIILGPPEQN